MSQPLPDPLANAYHVERIRLGQSLCAEYPSLVLQPLGRRALSLHTVLRAVDTPTSTFVATADQLLRQLVECAVDQLPVVECSAPTPTGVSFPGCALASEIVGVSIMRAGDAMESALRTVVPGIRIGKLLIQRDESVADKPARFIYSKMPPGVQQCNVLLLDPMLASGGSSICAIQHLLSQGIALSDLTFVCLIACPEGIRALQTAYPGIRIVAGILDTHLDERKYIVPGVGDFGDRYFGTVEQRH